MLTCNHGPSTNIMSLLRPCLPPSRQTSTVFSLRSNATTRWRHGLVRHQHAEVENRLPRIVQPSIWESIVPRSLRQRTKEAVRSTPTRPINPASYFIWIYILIGSQAIRILGVQNDFNAYVRKADLRLEKLREVVEKLQKGEPVDVEKVLGSGDEEQEQEWAEALKEIEDEERAWQESRRRREDEQQRRETEKQNASPVHQTPTNAEAPPDLPATLPRPPPSQPGFY